MPAISPLDDRYLEELVDYMKCVSEEAFMRYRARVELLYLQFLVKLLRERGIIRVSEDVVRRIEGLRLDEGDYRRFKELEAQTGHDVKALEYLLRERLIQGGLTEIAHLIHLGLTSEDVNNLALGVLLKTILYRHIVPEIIRIVERLLTLADKYGNLVMLGRTHGKPATPTTLGKEFAYHASRVCKWLDRLCGLEIEGKISGATGSYASFSIIDPETDWISKLSEFVKSLGFKPCIATTQILPPDSYEMALSDSAFMAQALLNLCLDLWIYNMLGYIRIRGKPIGSSTMPHKANPVDLENAEGNLKLAYSLLTEIARYIAISRLQRDLSDSTIKRNLGVAFAHLLLALRRLRLVLESLEANEKAIAEDLDRHWEVLSEALQVRLRLLGMPDAYERVKNLLRVESASREAYEEALKKLGVDDWLLRGLEPSRYVGPMRRIIEAVKAECDRVVSKCRSRCEEEVERLKALGFLY